MKISKVEGFLVSCPLPEPLVLPFYGGVRTVLKRDAMYIRVTADNDLAGFAPGPAWTAAKVKRARRATNETHTHTHTNIARGL